MFFALVAVQELLVAGIVAGVNARQVLFCQRHAPLLFQNGRMVRSRDRGPVSLICDGKKVGVPDIVSPTGVNPAENNGLMFLHPLGEKTVGAFLDPDIRRLKNDEVFGIMLADELQALTDTVRLRIGFGAFPYFSG